VVRPYRAAAVGIVDPEVTDARHLRVMDADRAGCRERGAAEESAVVAQVVLGNRHRRGGRQEAAVAGRAGLVAGQVPDRSDAADWLLLEHVERRRRRVRSCATLAVQNYDATRAKHFQQSDKKNKKAVRCGARNHRAMPFLHIPHRLSDKIWRCSSRVRSMSSVVQ